MLLKLIGKIRRQPKQTRENIALGIASSFTFVVAAIWLFNVPGTFNGMLSVNDSQDQKEGFIDKISSQTAAVKDALTPDEEKKESLKELIDEYRTAGAQASSTPLDEVSASSTVATTTPRAPVESFESFTTDSTYETDVPKEVRVQITTQSTTTIPSNE